MVTNLADKRFWEDEFYWSHAQVPCRPDPAFSFDRAVARELAAHAPVEPGGRVIEIGCAPAKWLVFYAERFGARVSGVEYSDKGAALSRANLVATGIEGQIFEADFFELEPQHYDLVLSLGFIEHFDDLAAAFDRHVEFLAPGGLLALGVPNFRGINRVSQWLADPAYLAMHNLAAMDRELFSRFANNRGLTLEYLDYFGGFEPALITPSSSRRAPARLLAKGIIRAGLAYRRLHKADEIDHPLLSCYLLGVFRKP